LPSAPATASAVPDYVLDTSALLALRGNEPGAARVEQILRRAGRTRSRVVASFMTRMELLYRISADESEEAAGAAIRLVDSTRLRWIWCDPPILERAARIKMRGGLSVADAWIAATAIEHAAVLVHKDPEFERVAGLRHERLAP
jgi:predicted nucleic acid-binding protein